jgi:DNA-binding MarR family transcriptional regulator
MGTLFLVVVDALSRLVEPPNRAAGCRPAHECASVDVEDAAPSAGYLVGVSDRSTGPVTEPATAAGGPVSHAIFRVARLHKLLAGQLLRETGLYPSQEQVMMQLWDSGPQRQVDLIRMTDSDAATMTRTVRRLLKAGFVDVSPSSDDRRVVMVQASEASKQLRPVVERIWGRLEEITVGDLASEEQERILRGLEALEANLLRTVD